MDSFSPDKYYLFTIYPGITSRAKLKRRCLDYRTYLFSILSCILCFVCLHSVSSVAGTTYPSAAPEFTPVFFSGVRVTRSWALCVCFVDRCLSFCPFSFGHCVVCSSSIYGCWLPLWYLHTHLVPKIFYASGLFISWLLLRFSWTFLSCARDTFLV